MLTHSEARRLAVSAALEEAERDLKFSGDEAIRKLGLKPDQAANLRKALLFYAENGAARGVALLALHGAFVDVLERAHR